MHSKMVAMIKEELEVSEKGSCTYSKCEKSVSTCGKYLKKALATKQNRLQDL